MAYRRDIDGLRAVAVLAVLLFHAMPAALPGGSWGVDVFFVISGFLISSHITRDLEAGAFSFVIFYARRARRLLPALFIVLAACCIAGWFILLPADFRSLGAHILSGALYVSNVTLWTEVGYFDSAAALKPLLHLWSLGVEEQFYLVWPVLLLAAFRFRRLGAVMLAVTAASFLCAVLSPPAAAFYLPWNRFWELGFGALLALSSHDAGRFATPLGILGIGLIAVALALPEGHSPWIALLPTIGATLLIASPAGWFNRAVLSSAPAVGIGRISYQLYLWHWPLLVFARHWSGDALPPWAGFALVALAFPLAAATYLIEQRIKHAPLRLPALAGSMAVAVLGIGAFGALVMLAAGFPGRFSAAYAAILDTKGAAPAWRNRTCFLDLKQPASDLAESCIDPGDGPLVLLWGDSHAAQLYPGLRALADQRRFRLAQITQSQCPFVPYIDYPDVPTCRDVNQAAIELIRRLKPAAVVIVARWSLYSTFMPDSLWTMGLDVVHSITDGKAIVIGSFPEWPLPLPQVIKAKLADGAAFPERIEPANDPAMRTHAARLVRESGLTFIDPFGVLCDEVGCLTKVPLAHQDDVLGQRPQEFLMSYDESHLTPAGAEFFVRTALGNLLR
jgi:peptidoglycan/LPS O-acetylase OafA/YrhL